MQMYKKEEAQRRINELAKEGISFIFIIDYAQDVSIVEETTSIDPAVLLYDLNGYTNYDAFAAPLPGKEVSWHIRPVTPEQYKLSFDIVMKNILAGNSFLTNLTCMTPVETNWSLKEIFIRSNALYKLWLKDRFTFFSPEIFIRIRDGKIYSHPMKGTIDALLPSAGQKLLDDVKEAAEHATIVDLIRNDLSMVADHVSVDRYRYIDRIQTNNGCILQTSSEISGSLPGDYLSRLGEIIFRLLPAGSITGAPKRKTMEIIAQAEGYDRGFYTGIAGYFDGKNLDSAVMIRFVEQVGDKLFYKSGGGITCKSDVNDEYNEMKQKVYVPVY